MMRTPTRVRCLLGGATLRALPGDGVATVASLQAVAGRTDPALRVDLPRHGGLDAFLQMLVAGGTLTCRATGTTLAARIGDGVLHLEFTGKDGQHLAHATLIGGDLRLRLMLARAAAWALCVVAQPAPAARYPHAHMPAPAMHGGVR